VADRDKDNLWPIRPGKPPRGLVGQLSQTCRIGSAAPTFKVATKVASWRTSWRRLNA